MNPLRLLMVSEPGEAGVFAWMDSIVRQIHKSHPEISVDLAYSKRRSGSGLRDLIQEIEKRGGKTIDLDIGNAPSLADFTALFKLLRFTKERGHQLVHAHSSKAGALSRIARLIAPFPPILYTPNAYYGMARAGGAKEAFYNFIETVLGRIGQTICSSADEKTFAIEILHLSPDRIHVIDLGIDTNRFIPADDQAKSSARAALGLPAQGKIMVTLGRACFQKNYAPIYKALDDLLPTANWYFSHAGAGSLELRATLSPQAAARCYSFAHLDDVLPLLQAADGYVMTSRYETPSLAMLEALSCELRTLLTDAPGFHALRGYGFDDIIWLPKPEHPEALLRSLKENLAAWALNSSIPTLHQQRELVCKMFSKPMQIEKQINLYNKY